MPVESCQGTRVINKISHRPAVPGRENRGETERRDPSRSARREVRVSLGMFSLLPFRHVSFGFPAPLRFRPVFSLFLFNRV